MTLAAESPINSYVGNNGANSYPFTFDTFLQTDLAITVTSPATTPITTTLAIGTDYTVAGLSAAGSPASTGTITLVNSGQAWLTSGKLASGWTLTIKRNMPFSQTASIRNQGDFYQEYLEDALDRIEMQIQQVQLSLAIYQTEIDALQAQLVVIQTQLTSTGLILTDIVNGNKYLIVMDGGFLSTQQL